MLRNDADRVELQTSLERRGIVVLADVYYSGWELTIDGSPAPLYRVNRMMRRRLAVDAGDHSLVFTYRPLSFRAGLIVSCVGLAASTILACMWTRDHRRDSAYQFAHWE